MRRRAEGLGLLHAYRDQGPRSTFLRRFAGAFPSWRRLRTIIRTENLNLNAGRVHWTDGIISPDVKIFDGLGALNGIGRLLRFAHPGGNSDPMSESLKVFPLRMIDTRMPVKQVKFERFENPTVRPIMGIPQVKVDSVEVGVLPKDKLDVRTIAMPGEAIYVRNGTGWLLNDQPGIREETESAARIPFILRTTDLNLLSIAEKESFLRETEALKKVSAAQGELLALFRRVPVEMISKVRFNAEKRALFYTLALQRNVQRTRLHDLAAVRDSVTGNVHLVPHRTRYRTVFL